jgi:hypothetical protein
VVFEVTKLKRPHKAANVKSRRGWMHRGFNFPVLVIIHNVLPLRRHWRYVLPTRARKEIFEASVVLEYRRSGSSCLTRRQFLLGDRGSPCSFTVFCIHAIPPQPYMSGHHLSNLMTRCLGIANHFYIAIMTGEASGIHRRAVIVKFGFLGHLRRWWRALATALSFA